MTDDISNIALRLFSGGAHPALASAIAESLEVDISGLKVRYFADGEIYLTCEESVRGCDAYVIQPTCPPVNDNFMELLICVDALRRASAERITAVVPYFGYARQEKRDLPREPITARLVADLLEQAGVDRVMVMDLHASAIQGFFRVPVDHITAAGLLSGRVKEIADQSCVVVSPDEGGVKHARRVAQHLGLPLAVVYSEGNGRDGNGPYDVAGHVEGKRPIIVEDMIVTGRSVRAACEALLSRGCLPEITILATHGVFVRDSARVVAHLDGVERIIVTDTVPIRKEVVENGIEVLTVAPLFAEAIRRVHTDHSISRLVAVPGA